MWRMSGHTVVSKTELQRRRKKRLHKFLCFVTIVAVVVISLAAWLYWRSMTPTILEIAKVQVRSQSTQAINEAVLALFSDGVGYDDFITIEKNQQNEVVLLVANSVQSNKLARDVALMVQAKIERQFCEELQIPIGTLSGVPLLNGKGPNVGVKISPLGSVTCSFVSDFTTAGINQTLHRIYLNVESRVDLIVPTLRHTVEIFTPILICETVIVGDVPDTFLQGGLLLGSS